MLSVQAPGVPKTLCLLSPGAVLAPGGSKHKQPLGMTGSYAAKDESPEVGSQLPSHHGGRSGSSRALTHHADGCMLLLLQLQF